MDQFFEYIVKRKKSKKDVLLIAAAAVLTVFVIFALMLLYATMFGTFALPLQALAVFLCWKFIVSRNVEFEYCVTSGDLDVDKIINRQKRKHLLTIEAKSIVSMAPLGDERLAPLGDREIIDVTSGDESDNVYCIIYGEGKGKALLFEPTEAMVLEIQKRNPRNVFVKRS